jgi:peroxiredoxin
MTKSKFKFNHIKIQTPELFYLIVDNGKLIMEFFGESGVIKIYSDTINAGKIEVSGSKTHEEYLTFMENNSAYEIKIKEIYFQIELAKSLKNDKSVQELDSVYQNVRTEQLNYTKKYVQENSGSFVSLYITLKTLSDFVDIKELETIKNHFKDTVKTSVYFKDLSEMIEIKKNIQIGKQAPDFSLPDSAGINHSLSSFQQKNALLYFGASWNKECMNDFKILKHISEKFKNQNLSIFYVCIESDKNNWLKMLKDEKPDWICVSDLKGTNSDVIQLYNVRKVPQIFLLNKNGIIINNNLNKTDFLNLSRPEIGLHK